MGQSSRAVAAACAATIVAAAAYLGLVPLAAAAGLLAVGVAVGWPSLLNQPAPGGSRLVIGLAGVGAVGVVAATDGEPALRHLPVVLAMAIVLAFLAELLRRDGRERLVESLSGTVSGIVVAVSCAGWVAAGEIDAGTSLVLTCAVALAVASAVSVLPLPGWWNSLVVVLVAVAAGAAVGATVPGLSLATGLWTGAVTGLLVASLHMLLDQLPGLERRATAASVAALPIAVAGILVFIVGRVLVG